MNLNNYFLDIDLDEIELPRDANQPSASQAPNQNVENHPVTVFQEILQNSTQDASRNFIQPCTSKISSQHFTPLQQSYSTIPVFQNQYPNIVTTASTSTVSSSPKSVETKCEEQLIKIENVKFEPITVEVFQAIPEQQPVQQVFYCNKESVPIVPYFPQVKYEPISVMPYPFFINYTSNCNNSENRTNDSNTDENIDSQQALFDVSSDSYEMMNNGKDAALDEKKQIHIKKKKIQEKRKTTKKSKNKKEKKTRSYERRQSNTRTYTRHVGNSRTDENPIEKRSMHNSMERQRRIGLKNLFIELKKVIPTLDDRDRVPKVSILREAITYCNSLQREEALLNELKKKNHKLEIKKHKLFKLMNK